MHRHVLHHAEHRDVHLAEHLHALLRVEQRQILRGGDDHRAGHRHLLRQGQLDVAGARRHVHHQVVEVVPGGLGDQLDQGAGDHRPAPDHRRAVVGEEGHRHHLYPVRLQGLEPLLLADLRPGAFRQAEHDALAGSVDVRVEDAHPRTLAGQGQGQVGGGGGLADAALAGSHRDDVLHVAHHLDLRLCLVRLDHAVDPDLGASDAVERLQGHLQGLRQAVSEQPGGVPQFQAHPHAVALDLHLAQAAGADGVLVQIGVLVLAEGGFHRLASDSGHGDFLRVKRGIDAGHPTRVARG